MTKRKLSSIVKKKLSDNVSKNDRSVVAVIGSSAHLAVASIYNRLIKLIENQSIPLSILWLCSSIPIFYEKEKKISKLRKRLKVGDTSLTEQDMFTILLNRLPVKFIHYQDENPLNEFYDLLVVEDFSSLTPNQLASTCESIKSPGCIIFLLNSITDLKQLYTLQMNSHKIYEKSSLKVDSLFNERFLLTLMTCPTFLTIDDNLKLVPLSNYPEEPSITIEEITDDETKLANIKTSTTDTQPLGALIDCCKTFSQAKAVAKMVEIVSSRESHVACLLGPRGRGKSSALGLAVVSAINLNFSNIFISTTSLDGLQIIFHYILLGLKKIGYTEGEDYQILRTSKSSLFTSLSSPSMLSPVNTSSEKLITRINIIRTCRQFVQFISPYEASRDELFRKSVQLLIIDEAASIPLDQIKSLIGPHMIFTSITNNGFKASGSNHVTSLLKELKREAKHFYDELILDQPINFSRNDSVESWINSSLCLDWSKEMASDDLFGCPAPDECQLFYINRSTLFSYHKSPETLLQQLMRLYFSSEYIVNANVIQAMADSPNHHLFCLLPPTSHKAKTPEVLCFIFLRLEDEDSPLNWTHDNLTIDGDSSISKLIEQEYLSSKLMSLHGARVIKIAINPKYDIPEYGYDRRALQLVEEYFKGNFNIKLIDQESTPIEQVFEKIGLNMLDIRPRDDCQPLFVKLEERRAEVLDYIVVNIGMTQASLKFWRRNGYTPIYINPESNGITREHDCILIKSLIRDDGDEDDIGESEVKSKENPNEWLINLWEQFRNRFISLLSCSFHHLRALLAVEVLQENDFIRANIKRQQLTKIELEIYMTLHDLKRLEIYTNFRDDYRRITDLIPHLARFFFLHKFDESIHLSPAQLIILLGVGLQGKTIDEMGDEIGLPGNQILAHFLKAVKKFSTWLNTIQEKAIEEALGLEKSSYEAIYSMRPVPGTLEDELEDASERIQQEEEDKRAKMSQEMKHLAKYAIKGTEDEWDSMLMGKHKSIVSIKSVQPKKPKNDIQPVEKSDKRKQKFKRKFK